MDHKLYKVEFHAFEAYCKAKWQYGRNYVDPLVSAAPVFTHLMTICHESKVQDESQVSPLILKDHSAWERRIISPDFVGACCTVTSARARRQKLRCHRNRASPIRKVDALSNNEPGILRFTRRQSTICLITIGLFSFCRFWAIQSNQFDSVEPVGQVDVFAVREWSFSGLGGYLECAGAA